MSPFFFWLKNCSEKTAGEKINGTMLQRTNTKKVERKKMCKQASKHLFFLISSSESYVEEGREEQIIALRKTVFGVNFCFYLFSVLAYYRLVLRN
jgi:hypothetical protein